MTDYAKNHVEIYPNAISIDGNQVLVKKAPSTSATNLLKLTALISS